MLQWKLHSMILLMPYKLYCLCIRCAWAGCVLGVQPKEGFSKAAIPFDNLPQRHESMIESYVAVLQEVCFMLYDSQTPCSKYFPYVFDNPCPLLLVKEVCLHCCLVLQQQTAKTGESGVIWRFTAFVYVHMFSRKMYKHRLHRISQLTAHKQSFRDVSPELPLTSSS